MCSDRSLKRAGEPTCARALPGLTHTASPRKVHSVDGTVLCALVSGRSVCGAGTVERKKGLGHKLAFLPALVCSKNPDKSMHVPQPSQCARHFYLAAIVVAVASLEGRRGGVS